MIWCLDIFSKFVSYFCEGGDRYCLKLKLFLRVIICILENINFLVEFVDFLVSFGLNDWLFDNSIWFVFKIDFLVK